MKTGRLLFLLTTVMVLAACRSSNYGTYGSPNIKQTLINSQTFKIDIYSDDPTYGYTEQNPVMVGREESGPLNERRFLNALTGPDGEAITYSRLGSCCHFKTKNGLINNAGLLDKYEVAYKGLEKPIILYINMYDSDVLKIPVGFKKK